MGRTASKATSRPKSKASASCHGPIVRPLRRAKTMHAKTAQGEQLPLPLKGSWGGARAGAGRKPTGKAGVPHRARPEHNWRHPVHVSLEVDPTLPNLRTPLCVRTIEACFRALQLAHAKQQGKQAQTAQHQHSSGGTTGTSSTNTESSKNSRIGFRLVHYSVQPHHLHLIVEAQDRQTLERGLRGLAIRLARQLDKALGRRGRVFVDRYFARALKTPRETRNCLRYVLLNTAKHELQRRAQQRAQRRGWRGHAGRGHAGRGHAGQARARAQVEVPERGRDWLDPCSSGVYFEGWKEGSFREGWLEELVRRKARGKGERMAAERARLVLPVTEARTWLLQRGWRERWGLISLNEVPGPRVRAAHEVRGARKMADR